MGFTVFHGTSGLPSLGEALNQAGRNYLAGRQVADEEKRTQQYIDAANRALEEHEAKRQAAGAYGSASAAMALPEGQGMQGPGSVEPEDAIHGGTGLPDYRDPETLKREVGRVGALKSTFPSTPEGQAAFGEFAKEQQARIEGHVLDNQEAESIDEIADSVAAMSMGEGMEPYVQSLQQIEQGIRATKGMEPKMRAQALQEFQRGTNAVRVAAVKQQEKTRKITEAVGFLDQQLGSTSPFDPNREVYGQAKALIMAGADPSKVLEKAQTHIMGLVEVEPGVYANKETATYMVQQKRLQQQGEVAQEKNALTGRANDLKEWQLGLQEKHQAFNERVQDFKEKYPPGTAKKATKLQIFAEARRTAEFLYPPDKETGEANPNASRAYNSFVRAYRDTEDEPGEAKPDAAAEFDRLSPEDQKRYMDAAAGGK